MDLAAAGAEYLRAGLSIIALTGKAPNGRFHPHGLKEPYAGESNIGNWELAARHRDTTGVGLVIPEHLVVVDIDGEEGAVEFRRLVGAVPETAVARTARGLHLWFVSPHQHRSTKLGPKLDLKGAGGYVCGPPSVHPGDPESGLEPGFVYHWLDPLVVDVAGTTACQVDWLPDFIEEVLAERKAHVRLAVGSGGGSMKGLADHLAAQGEGNRNAALYWAACVARDDGHALGDALSTLAEAAMSAGLDRREAVRTIRSAYRAK